MTDKYPINSTAKQYTDSDGNLRTLWQMVRDEPEWAESRIRAGEEAIARIDELEAQLKQIEDSRNIAAYAAITGKAPHHPSPPEPK